MTARLAAGDGTHSILIPEIAVAEAERVGCDLAAACVMLILESSGGRNVFQGGTEVVTEESYRAYLATRDETGARGIGPTQLTWAPLQDEADELGGCWRPEINCRVGFKLLDAHIRAHGHREAFGRYRAGMSWAKDPDAVTYVERAMGLLATWQAIVAGP